MLGNLHAFVYADFFEINFFKKFYQEHLKKSLDPDQDRQNVGPDLGPNPLQRLSADDKSYIWQGKG